MGPGAGGRLDASAHFVKDYGRNDRAGLRGCGNATLGMTWRFEPVSRLRCHRPSPIVRASATRVPNAPSRLHEHPAARHRRAPGSGAFPVALRAPSNAPDPIKQTAAIRSPDQGHAVPCRRWTPDLCGNDRTVELEAVARLIETLRPSSGR